jgi:hypothetical protein
MGVIWMDFTAIQGLIRKIDGVMSVKLVIEEDELREVHILGNTLRAPKQIVRDIESSLLAAFDYRIDRKIISIAQIQNDDNIALRRIKYSGIDFKTEGNALDCTVYLSHDGEEFSEKITGIKTAANRKKIVAAATVRSVEAILGQAFLFNVEDVFIHTYRDINYVTVIVNMVLNENEETMIGSAIVRQDANEAIAKAALDAVNRRILRGTF